MAAEREQRERRWTRLIHRTDGGYDLAGQLDPETGAGLKAALKALMPPPAADDKRTTDQRRHDALGELVRRTLDAGELPERGGERPHLFVMAEMGTLHLEPGSSMAKLDWGIDISGESARRIGCDASITPVLMSRDGDVLHVGTASRTVPPRLRKALNLRDRTCQWEGCTVRAEHCQTHHRDGWLPSRWTDGAGIRLYCDRHHRALHPENDRFRRPTGTDHRAPPPA